MEVFIPIWGMDLSKRKWVQVFLLGPTKNLIPNERKSINSIDKNSVISRQKYKCNACKSNISLYPYANCDLDHIIPLSLGGFNTLSNYQYLCVLCHRNKTGLENEKHIKRVNIQLPDTNLTYILCLNKETDVEDIGECDPITALDMYTDKEYIATLNYKKKIELVHGKDLNTIFEKFAYKG